MTSWRGPHTWIVMLVTPVWPESGFLARDTLVAAALSAVMVAMAPETADKAVNSVEALPAISPEGVNFYCSFTIYS
jgi:hypothetical protein